MDAAQVAAVRELLATTGWVDRTRDFGRALHGSVRRPGGLLLVGTPDEEPWHLTAHLNEEAQYAGSPELAATLVRWSPPPDAPPHLAVTLARLEQAGRGESVLVVAEEVAPVPLLERVADARKHGATVLAVDSGDPELEGLAHEALSVASTDLVVPDLSFDTVQHLVSASAGDAARAVDLPIAARRSLRSRLGAALDSVVGSTSPRR